MKHSFLPVVVTSLVAALGGCSDGSSNQTNTMEPGVLGFDPAASGGFTAGTVAGGGAGIVADNTGAGSFGTAGAGFPTAGVGFPTAGFDGSAGFVGGVAGTEATAGVGGVAGMAGSAGGTPLSGTCCSDGDCLCRDEPPSALTSSNGKYKTATYNGTKGTIHYPTDATPPFAAVAICGGFTNTGPEMAPWGTFYASHGIVTLVTSTLGTDSPDVRATKLRAAIDELEAENAKSGGPLFGKLSGHYGTSGYSMGGGGTTIASGDEPTLRSSIGLAAWSPDGSGVQVPTLLLCGSADGTAPCSMSQGAYTSIPTDTPKMMISITGVGHLSWFGPTSAGGGTSGKYALAFQKVYLEGDERWKPLLLGMPSNGTMTTNIK